MKTSFIPAKRWQQQQGSAVIVVLAMLAIMLIFISANTIAVRSLGRELKLLEKRQVQRIQPAAQNQPSQVKPSAHD